MKPSTMSAGQSDETRLFNCAMKGQWEEVFKTYRTKLWIHKAKITRFGGTALHVAVSEANEETVKTLLDIISESQHSKIDEVLKIGDERGNTPLHTAALLGNARMCLCIANKDTSLIGVRNGDGETPFYLAALHGHKHAFLCLHSLLCEQEQPTREAYEYSRRNDGETILHCAIAGDYFDLAFQIIHKYKDLANYVNERGLSPLHLLAAKPSAFRSGSHLGHFKGFIYHCIFVDKLQVENFDSQTFRQETNQKKLITPPNYETCYHFIKMLLRAIAVVTRTAAGHIENEGKAEDAEDPRNPKSNESRSSHIKAQGHQLFPPNYTSSFEFVKVVSKAILVILGLGSNNIRKLRDKKQKHRWSIQLMNELLEQATLYQYDGDGKKPVSTASIQPDTESHDETKPYDVIFTEDSKVPFPGDEQLSTPASTSINVTGANQQRQQQKAPQSDEENNQTGGQKIIITLPESNRGSSHFNFCLSTDSKERLSEMEKGESPILIAAKNGITEIVEKILEKFPVAIHDMNSEKKNVVLLAVENRQPHVYQLLLKRTNKQESVFRRVDHDGNSALHLAAKLGQNKPWLIPGAALQMQWEIKWYEFVKDSMPFHFFVRYNENNQSPRDVFSESHKELVEAGGQWLTNTSESCSVVAALIATVAFATSATVPGGVNQDSGTPTLENQPAFNLFAITSLVALCFSVTSVVMFLAILTSRYQERDFGSDLPGKLLLGLTSLFVSIASILVSFCAGHFFVLKDQLKYAAFPVYAVTCLPITFFAIAQFPLYFDLIWATFRKVPQRSYKHVPI